MEYPDDFNEIPDWNLFKFYDDEEGEDWNTGPIKKAAENLYNQGRQIYQYSKFFCELLKDEIGLSSKDLIMQNAIIICPKIAGAEGGGIYIIRMENASIIRTNCIELLTQIRACMLFDEHIENYAGVLINEIEVFKKLFEEWVSLFEKDEIDDDWGLY